MITNANTNPLIYLVTNGASVDITDVYMNSTTMGAIIDANGDLFKLAIGSLSGSSYPGTHTQLSSGGDKGPRTPSISVTKCF